MANDVTREGAGLLRILTKWPCFPDGQVHSCLNVKEEVAQRILSVKICQFQKQPSRAWIEVI